MTFITSVTQKGQVTLPKNLRDRFKIKEYDSVEVVESKEGIVIRPVKDILDLAGTFKPTKHKDLLKAREELEKKYKRT